MFDASKVIPEYANLLGWKSHYDPTEIPAFPPSLTDSDSGEFYQQKHPALRLDIIQALIPDNYPLETYLRDQITDSTVEMMNDIFQARQVGEYGKTLLDQKQVLNKYGFINDKIANDNRFVGFQIRTKTASGLQAAIRQIGFQFDTAQTLPIYLFYSGKTAAIQTTNATISGQAQWDWESVDDWVLPAFTNDDDINGGVFILGYYQEDVLGHAINLTNFNWDRGACGSCNKSFYKHWKQVNEYFTIYPLYWAQGNYTKLEMPDLQDAIYTSDFSWGLNLKMTVECDLTDFFILNKMFLTNLLSLKVTEKILNQMKFSQQINFVEENIKMMIIRDLEGDLETRMNNITKKYQNEIKAVAFNTSNINEKCLPCTDAAFTPNYGVI